MDTALVEVSSQLGRTCPLILNGQTVPAAATFESLNPSHTKQIVGRCGRASAEQAKEAVAAAKAAFPAWRDTDASRRAEYLFAAANVMRRRRFELAAWQVYECGKPRREADADVAESIDYCEFYGREMLRLAVPRRRDVPGEENVYFYEPRGVTVVIAPWNFPMAILCGMTTAALVTGNTVIMKPAEQSSVIGAKLMEVFQEVGLPPGVVNLLAGHRRGGRSGADQSSRCRPDRLHRLARRRSAASIARRPKCRLGRTTSSAFSPRWAARTPSSLMTTPTWTRPCMASSPARSATPARNARRAAGSWCRSAARGFPRRV